MLKILAFIQQFNAVLLIGGVILTVGGLVWRLKRKLTEEKAYRISDKAAKSQVSTSEITRAQRVFRRMS